MARWKAHGRLSIRVNWTFFRYAERSNKNRDGHMLRWAAADTSKVSYDTDQLSITKLRFPDSSSYSYCWYIELVVFNVPLDTTGHFRDESFQAIDSTGTDKQQ